MSETRRVDEIDSTTLEAISRLPTVLSPNVVVLATSLGPQIVFGDTTLPGPPNFFSRMLVPLDAAENLVGMLSNAIEQAKSGMIQKRDAELMSEYQETLASRVQNLDREQLIGLLETATAEKDSLKETILRQSDAVRKIEAELRDISAREAKTRTQFEDLKTRLYNAEIENARLRGYLSRVHEADVARDGLVEIEDAQGKRLVPKWAPPQHLKPSIDYAEQNDGYDIMTGRRKPTTHWTSY